MIIDIRGTHGSGKSFCVHSLINNHESTDIMGEHPDKPKLGTHPIGHFLPEYDLAIVGRYDRTCGGCDGVSPVAEICRRLRLFNEKYSIVVLEGILVSHTFQRYSDLANEIPNYHFCFLDTPLKTCIARVRKRRRERGNDKPLDPKNIIKDHKCVWGKIRLKMEEAGHIVHTFNHKDPYEDLMHVIQRWDGED